MIKENVLTDVTLILIDCITFVIYIYRIVKVVTYVILYHSIPELKCKVLTEKPVKVDTAHIKCSFSSLKSW